MRRSSRSGPGVNGYARQLFAIGQTRHLGLRATQTIAPKSISAWLKSKTCAMRHERFRHRPEMALHRVALGIALADEHAEQHARDVGVENGRALAEREAADRAGRVGADALERQQRLLVGRQLAVVVAPPPRARSSAAAWAGCCSRADTTWRSHRARAPRPARASDGYFSSHSAYFGSTRSTCVCCSMISETRMWYGSSVFRHGRSRPWRPYHVSSRWRNRRRRGGGGQAGGVLRGRFARRGFCFTGISYNRDPDVRENLHAHRRHRRDVALRQAAASARPIRASTRTARSTS